MSKKDYIEIARRFKELLEDTPRQDQRDGIWLSIRVLTDIMKADNSGFDQERFLNAITG